MAHFDQISGVIETDRLRLRPLVPDDLDALLWLHAEPDVIRFMGPLNRAQATERLAAYQSDWRQRGYGLMAMLDRRSGRFIGRTGLKYWPQFDETEVGWVLHPAVWGQGLATEAGRACLRFGLRHLEVPYYTAMIRPDNHRSIAVAERLGMMPLRNDDLLGVPVVVYWLRAQRPAV